MTKVIVRELAPNPFEANYGYEFEYRQCIYTGVGCSVGHTLRLAQTHIDKLRNPDPPKSSVHVFEI